MKAMKVLKVLAYALIQDKNLDYWKRKLTITSKGNRKFTINLYVESENRPDCLWIPRALVSDSKVAVSESKDWYLEKPLKSNIKLKPEQKLLKEEFMSALNSYSPYGGIIEAKTGFGKTYLTLDIIAELGGRTLIVVPTTYLLQQWKEKLINCFNLSPNDIGLIRQSVWRVDKPVVIGLLHSLAMKTYPSYVYNRFHNVIVDECHKISTLVFSRITPLFHAKYFIGNSATPRRKDGTEAVFKYCIGEVIAQSKKLVTRPKVLAIAYKGVDTSHTNCVFRGELNLGKFLNKLEISQMRNELIAKVVAQFYKKDKDILVLSDRLGLLDKLASILKVKGVKHRDIGYLTGQIKDVDKKVILGTYGSAGLGADIPRLDVLVFATPRTDIEQAFGRVTRCADKIPIVVDIVDTASSIMRRWFLKRMSFYRKYANEVIKVGL